MKPLEHIEDLNRDCHLVQVHGHCRRPDQFVAINKIEIAVHELRRAFEGEIPEKDRKEPSCRLLRILSRLKPGRK